MADAGRHPSSFLSESGRLFRDGKLCARIPNQIETRRRNPVEVLELDDSEVRGADSIQHPGGRRLDRGAHWLVTASLQSTFGPALPESDRSCAVSALFTQQC